MISRNNILARLRKGEQEIKSTSLPKIIDANLYADFPEDNNLLINKFQQNLEKLNGEVFVVNNVQKAGEKLLNIIKDFPENSCLVQKNSLIDQIIDYDTMIHKYMSDEGLSMNSVSFANFEAGITAAEYLVARTGSIIINTLSSGGRRLSVLPPLHIVIADNSQLVSSLDEGLTNLKRNSRNWSYATIITGPSRTSDIEKQLVLGAHGPKRLVVILINQ